MSDQCKNCTVRGDYEACIATPCSKHESWIDTTRIERIKELEKQVEAMGWRPVEEVPRTGEEVDLWDDFAQDRITDCKWMKNAWHRWEPNAFETMDWCRVHGKLTHFMRKPQPPSNFGKN